MARLGGITAATDVPSGTGVLNKLLIGDGTNYVASTPAYPNAGTPAGKVLITDGTNIVLSTPTYPNSATTAGKVLIADGTNIVLSTPTFPNASAISGKIIRSDGTNWVASTETHAVPGTNGNLMTSDGTNWTSAAPALGFATVSRVVTSDFQSASLNLTNITGLAYATAANTTYKVDVWLRGQSTGTAGAKFAMAHSGSGSTGLYLATLHGTTAGAGGINSNVLAGNTVAVWLTANTDSLAVFSGTVKSAAAAGSITMQVAKVTSADVRIFMGSLMSVTVVN